MDTNCFCGIEKSNIEVVQIFGIYIRVHNPLPFLASCQSPPSNWAVVLLHGWLGSPYDFCELGCALAVAGLRSFAPCLPFHSPDTLSPEPESPAQAALQILVALEKLLGRNANVILVGYSMGGRLALEIVRLSHNTPRAYLCIQGAVILSASLPCESERQKSEAIIREEKLAAKIMSIKSSSSFENWLRADWYSAAMWGALPKSSKFDRVLEKRALRFSEHRVALWARAAISLGTSRMAPFLEPCGIPLLYMHGTLDSKYSNMVERYKRYFLRFSSKPVKGAGHSLLEEDMSAVVFAVLIFVSAPDVSAHIQLEVLAFRALEYNLPLTRAIYIASQQITSREGALISVTLSNGTKGVGDMAPLPNWHRETLQDCMHELRNASELFRKMRVCPLCFDIYEFGRSTSSFSLSTATMTALESAFVQALCGSLQLSVPSFLRCIRRQCFKALQNRADPEQAIRLQNLEKVLADPVEPVEIKLNGVLPRTFGDNENVDSNWRRDQIEQFVQNTAFTILKMKIGICNDVEDEAEMVKHAISVCRKHEKRLRLDANRSWDQYTWNTFQRLLKEDSEHIQYVEEPLASAECLYKQIKHEQARDGLKIALDESVNDCSPTLLEEILRQPNCTTVVLKPTMHKSLSDFIEHMLVAETYGAGTVVSSTFDSGAGLAWQAHLATLCSHRDSCHGLATYDYLDRDVSDPPFRTSCTCDDRVRLKDCVEFMERCIEMVSKNGVDVLDITKTPMS